MSEKVKLPNEVVEALEYATKELSWSIGNILTKTVRRDWDSNRMQILNSDKDEFVALIAKALVNGYEVEETPEERVLRMFKEAVTNELGGAIHTQRYWWEGRRMAIIDTLNALEIKIEGINP